ncbi:hypothetical protein CE91St38_04760 [Desulfovibrionaceae bacterium]|nr:hypothetical protein CE91St38_04760 [Desulfovibrionaceae bacterium]GKI11019.1 hypothetical protein CE91St39_04730 [Desulfovibrionaceae bacterium]
MTQELLNDGQRLLGAKEAIQYLNNMPKTTFYRNIKRGILPKQRYLGGTPVWRLEDLRVLYDQLPEEPEDTNDPYAVIE